MNSENLNLTELTLLNKKLSSALERQASFADALNLLSTAKIIKLDLTANNKQLLTIDLQHIEELDAFIHQELARKKAELAIGGYFEKRVWYQRSTHFDTAGEPRTVHIGIDIWAPVLTPVFAPLAGRIHSFQHNNNFGDYGPTIILEHELEGIRFFSLYGHLSLESLSDKTPGTKVNQGQQIGELGNPKVNGNWPPHLHIQLMLDLLNNQGDFPGVCRESDVNFYSTLCPDPNLILRCKSLKS